MLERRLERWTPDEAFQLMPVLLRVSKSHELFCLLRPPSNESIFIEEQPLAVAFVLKF